MEKIRKGLSAGRVQSVAVRIIVDREDEIRAFISEEYWTLDALLADGDKGKPFPARFHGTKEGKLKIENKEQADALLEELKDTAFTVGTVKRAPARFPPAPPFITSTLQQEASRKLGFAPGVP